MKAKKIIVAILMIALMGVMSGCVYSNNKNWDDLSVQEQQEVKQALDDAREEIIDDFPLRPQILRWKSLIKVEEAIIK